MPTYYQDDLAWVHHVGYSHHVERTFAGILQILRDGGLGAGARVLDVGCGSGLLAQKLSAAGFEVRGVDASPAMIELARNHVRGARFDVLRLPTGLPPGADRALPDADAVVSTGHVLNYLDSRDDIARSLVELAGAVRPGGVLAIDLMIEDRRKAAVEREVHARLADDWAIYTRFTRPAPDRLDRAITVFRRVGDVWRRSDETHRNLSFDAEVALRLLRANGIDAISRPAFGDEKLPQDLIVLTGVRR
ncbi:MAG: class I SAM-dependent methyltransferase [Casimicrobiaceae bacterium]